MKENRKNSKKIIEDDEKAKKEIAKASKKEEKEKIEIAKASKKEEKEKIEIAKANKKEEKEKIEFAKANKKEEKAERKQEKIKAKKEKDNEKVKNNVEVISLVVLIIIVLGLIGYVFGTIIKKQNYKTVYPVATIEVENFGTIKVELYPQYAPNTVANFIALANHGFYNGLTFHRTIPDFMIQGGDKNGDGSGSATLKDIGGSSDDKYAIKGEFILNGFTQNNLKHERGVISMARSDYSSMGTTSLVKKGYDSASSQFFIMTKDNTSLDGSYAAFGKVIEGMDVVDKISNVEVETRDSNSTDQNLTADRPVNPPVIKSITVDTKGVDYGTPETVEPFDYYSYMMQQYYGGSATGTSSTIQ